LSCVAAAIAVNCKAQPAASLPDHRFEVVSAAHSLSADGTENEDQWEQCLFGRYPPGTTVLLIPDGPGPACKVATGRVGLNRNGDCTVLAGIQKCSGRYGLGVIGASPVYRTVESRPIREEATRRALASVIGRAHVVDAAMFRWKTVFRDSPAVDANFSDAISFPGLDGSPTLVRLSLLGRDAGEKGPWLAVRRDEAGTLIGPFSTETPVGFTLDGRSYIHVGVACCTACGCVGSEVHRVEGGRLRRVLESFGNAN
jgi:hypothetical protein